MRVTCASPPSRHQSAKDGLSRTSSASSSDDAPTSVMEVRTMFRSGSRRHGRPWTRVLLPVAAVALVGGVSTQPAGALAARPAAAGHVVGGVTTQGWPIVIEVDRNGRRVVRVVVGMDLKCTSAGQDSFPYRFEKLRIADSGRFSTAFPPQTQRLQDGTTRDYSGGISGRFNTASTGASGSWHFKESFYDATGAVSDTCQAADIRWSAKA
jgi:hypothetical protein